MRIKQILDEYLYKKEIYIKVKGMLPLLKWDEIVGEQLAKNCKPAFYKDGKLFVAVDNPILRKEISLLSNEIINKISSLIPGSPVLEIKTISRTTLNRFSKKIEAKAVSHNEDVELSIEDFAWIDSIINTLKWDKKMKQKYRELLISYRKSVKAKEAMGFKKCKKCGVYFSGKGKVCPVCEIQGEK